MIWRYVSMAAIAAAVFLIAWLVLDSIFGKTPMQQRIELLRRFGMTKPVIKGRLLAAARTEITRLGEWLAGWTRLDNQALLDAAAMPVRPAEWLVVRFGAALGGALLLSLSLPWALGLLLGGALGFILPNVLVQVRIDRRKRAFAEELPDTLQMIVSSLRAGFTLQHGIEASVRDTSGPVAVELRRALSETRLGAELEDALAGVGLRTGNHDMKWLVMAIKLQREVGGSLSEVLQTTADTMREREELRRSVRALSAEGRLSATILLAMPILLALWMFLFRPAYVRPLYTQPLGVVMLVVAGGLMVVGVLWLRAVVKVEV